MELPRVIKLGDFDQFKLLSSNVRHIDMNDT